MALDGVPDDGVTQRHRDQPRAPDSAGDPEPFSFPRWLFPLLTVSLCAALGVALFPLALAIRRSLLPIYIEGPGYKATGQRFLYDRLLGWRNIPSWKSKTFGQPLTINSKGLRDREYPYEKPAGTRRILVLGDSYTWGYGVSDSDLYTEVLERELNQAGPKCEVLNAGVSGWGTDQEYLYFREEGRKYSADVVVLMFFFNDLSESITSLMYGTAKPLFKNTALELENVPVPPPWKRATPVVSEADPFDLVVAIMAELARLCAAEQSRLVVAKFGNSLSSEDPKLRAMERELESRLALLDLPYLDLDEELVARGLSGRKLVSVPDGHWNVAGHRQTAAALRDFLLRRCLLE